MNILHFATHSEKAAQLGLLRIKCPTCRGTVDVDVGVQTHLPECPKCGPTEWKYWTPAITILRQKGILA